MTRVSAKQARQVLLTSCQVFIEHNQSQLARLNLGLSRRQAYFAETFDGLDTKSNGFITWMSYHYHELLRDISHLYSGCPPSYYLDFYPGLKNKTTYFLSEEVMPPSEFTERFRLLDRLGVVLGFVRHIMVEHNKVQNFEERWLFYHKQNYKNIEYHDGDISGVKIYKNLTLLKSMFNFLNTLTQDELGRRRDYLISQLTRMTPTLERFIKGAVVQDLQAILDDAELSDEEALELVGAHINDPMVRSILEKNLQSKAEHILKVLSVILIAVGIGIIPTVILASKRLYDSGGKSMNFFKPLSKQVEGEIEGILANTIETPVL